EPPSVSVTSHSSRSQPPAAAALLAPMSHHSPDVLHGPDALTTVPPANPRRSVVTRTGRPLASAATRPGTGWRQRRRATVGSRQSAIGSPDSAIGSPESAIGSPESSALD